MTPVRKLGSNEHYKSVEMLKHGKKPNIFRHVLVKPVNLTKWNILMQELLHGKL